MSSPDPRPVVQVGSPAGLLAAIPHLLGFHPAHSLVVVGVTEGGRVQVAFRYDLPDPPEPETVNDITRHALAMLASQQLLTAVVAGYGPGRLVTPLADALRGAAPRAGIGLHDVLRVEDGRYWSYLCTDPACCPAEGVGVRPGQRPGREGDSRGAAAGGAARPGGGGADHRAGHWGGGRPHAGGHRAGGTGRG